MSKNKLINVAVIGNPKSGKTFVIDAIVRILNQIDKIHKSDRIISNKEVSTNKDLAKILKDYKIIKSDVLYYTVIKHIIIYYIILQYINNNYKII